MLESTCGESFQISTITTPRLISAMDVRDTCFTTNQASSADECQAIETLVQLFTKLELDVTESSTRQEGHDVAGSIVHLESVQHSMRFVPDDVLELIFAHSTPWCLADGIAEDSFPWYSSTDHTDSPWTLSQVCRNWRALVLSLPHLWSTCRLIFPRVDNTKYAKRIEVLYRRSKTLPLRLYISTSPRSSIDFVKFILPSLLKAAHRWRCLRVDTRRNVGMLGTILHNRLLPNLTHLSWNLDERRAPRTTVLAPCLQSLELLCASMDEGLVLPWEQITQYKSVCSDPEFIERMPHLEEIVFEDNNGAPYNDYVVVPATSVLPTLTRMEIYNFDGCRDIHPYQLFRRYDFTALRTLVIIETSCTNDRSSPSPFLFFLPSLIELSLSFENANNVRSILPHVPNVEILHVDGEYGPDTLVHSTIPGQPSAVDLRALTDLSIVLVASPLIDVVVGWVDLTAWDRALTTLRLCGIRLETLSFYSGILEERVASEGQWIVQSEDQWIAHIQAEMAGSPGGWIEDGVQVLYYYDVDHRF